MKRLSLLLLFVLSVALSACRSPDAHGKAKPLTLPAMSAASSQPAPDAPASHRSDVLTLSGTAAPIRVSRLGVNAAGIIRKIKVREGTRVKKGQVLCILDATTSSLRTQAARTGKLQAEAALADAKRDLERAEKLAQSGALSKASLEKARLGLRMARLAAKAAGVQVHMAGSALNDSQLRAPFAGLITKVMAEEGQYVSFMPPAPVFSLADVDRLKLTVPIPERYIRFVHKGSKVKVWLEAMDIHRDEVVSRMAEVIDPMTRSAEAVIIMDNKDHKLPGGLFATVQFPGVSASGARKSGSVAGAPSTSSAPAPKPAKR